ncbi:hypothetical protein [Jatrophihabitans endophyticus]|uniref:hypothetical protein n=1 Tax=Jatrophihabitans endophyticus TaxID=1206085 RepID=UPI001A0AE6BF|nr:hypothetical protein [Jatrophihabitans endophyticus]MBE7189477.1 hypothetical protein [Jatrophihabitans endophyticus]
MPSKDELRQQLTELNQQIAELGGETDELFAQTGGDTDGAQDSEDVAAELTNAEETQGMLDALYKRRERLRAELDAG